MRSNILNSHIILEIYSKVGTLHTTIQAASQTLTTSLTTSRQTTELTKAVTTKNQATVEWLLLLAQQIDTSLTVA